MRAACGISVRRWRSPGNARGPWLRPRAESHGFPGNCPFRALAQQGAPSGLTDKHRPDHRLAPGGRRPDRTGTARPSRRPALCDCAVVTCRPTLSAKGRVGLAPGIRRRGPLRAGERAFSADRGTRRGRFGGTSTIAASHAKLPKAVDQMAPVCGNRHRVGFGRPRKRCCPALWRTWSTPQSRPETGAIGSAPTCANSPALVDILTSDVGTAARARAVFRGRRAAVADRACCRARGSTRWSVQPMRCQVAGGRGRHPRRSKPNRCQTRQPRRASTNPIWQNWPWQASARRRQTAARPRRRSRSDDRAFLESAAVSDSQREITW
jgi:hypothetical protein